MTHPPTWSSDDRTDVQSQPRPTTSAPSTRVVTPSWLPVDRRPEFDPDATATTVDVSTDPGDCGSTTLELDLEGSGRYELWGKIGIDRDLDTPVWTAGTVTVTVDEGHSYSLRTTRVVPTWRPFLAEPLVGEHLELHLEAGSHSLFVDVQEERTTVHAFGVVPSASDAGTVDPSTRVSDQPFLMTDS